MQDQHAIFKANQKPVPSCSFIIPTHQCHIDVSYKTVGIFQQSFVILKCEGLEEKGSCTYLLFIDQHAMHERIRLEKLQKEYSTPLIQRTISIIPSVNSIVVSEEIKPDTCQQLSKYGITLEISPKNPCRINIKQIPSAFRSITQDFIRGLRKLTEYPDQNVPIFIDTCLKSLACHGAIKANQFIEASRIENLLSELQSCQYPFICAHGRPSGIMLLLIKNELFKA